MRHQSPIHQFNGDNYNRISPKRRLNFESTPTEQSQSYNRSSSITPVAKVTKITVHQPVIQPQTVTYHQIRPVERRTVQLYDTMQMQTKPIEYVQNVQNVYHSVNNEQQLASKDQLIEQFRLENVRLNQVNTDLQSHLETWKIKYQNLEKEVESLSARSNQIETYKTMLQENRANYEQEIQTIRYELQNSKKMFQKADQDLYEENSKLKQIMQEKENSIALLSTEIERMNCLSNQKQNQLDQLKNVEKELTHLQTQLKVRDDIIDERNQEIGKLRRQVLRIPELENLLTECRQENEQLHGNIEQYVDEIECRNKAIDEMETQLDQANQANEKLEEYFKNQELQVQQLNSTNEQNQLIIKKLEQSNQEVQQKYDELQFDYQRLLSNQKKTDQSQSEVQKKYDDLCSEYLRVMQIIKKLEQQQIDFSKKYDDLQGEYQKIQLVNKKLESYQQDLQRKYDEQSQDCSRIQLNFASKCEEITILKEEIDFLRQQVDEGQDQIDQLRNDGSELSQIKGSLVEQLNLKTQEILQQKLSYDSLIRDLRANLESISSKNHELQERQCMQTQELSSVNMKLKGKQSDLDARTQECTELNLTIKQLQSQIKILNENINVLNSDIVTFKKFENETNNLSKSVEEKSTRINQLSQNQLLLEQNLVNMTKKKNSLEEALNDEQLINQQWRQKATDLERNYNERLSDNQRLQNDLSLERKKSASLSDQLQQINQSYQLEKKNLYERISQIESSNNSSASRILTQQKEIEQLKGDLASRDLTLQKIQPQLQEYQDKLVMMSTENERLSSEFKRLSLELQNSKSQLSSQIESYEERLSSLNRMLKQKESDYDNLQLKSQSQYKEIQQLLLEIKQLQHSISDQEQQFDQYEQHITDYRDQITYLENELDTWKQKFISVNREYHKLQEDHIMHRAEFDAYKQRKVGGTNSKDLPEVKKSTLGISSISGSVLNQFNLEKENQLKKPGQSYLASQQN